MDASSDSPNSRQALAGALGRVGETTDHPLEQSSSGLGNAQARSDEHSQSAYEYPKDYENIDEEAVGQPVDDRPSSQRPSTFERALGQSWKDNHPGRDPGQLEKGSSQQHRSRPNDVSHDNAELTEVAAPPPVEEGGNGGDCERFLETRAAGKPKSSESASGGFSPATASPQPTPQAAKVPKVLTELYTVSYLIFFSFLGTLARLGVQWLAFYPGAPVTTPVIWANFGGSLVMGFLAEDQSLFSDSRRVADADRARELEKTARNGDGSNENPDMSKADFAKHKKTIPLYVGLATGFCGSFTSFSSFARDYFLALSNNLPTPINHPSVAGAMLSNTTTVHRNGGYSFIAFIGVIMQTLALSLGGLVTGAQIAAFLEPWTPAIPVSFARRILDRAIVVLAFGCWLGAIFFAIWPPDRPDGPASRGSWSNETWRGQAIFALVFAPLGCLLRFYASLKLNGLVPAFPLGTFAVNMLGTTIEGMCYDLQHVPIGVMGRVGGGRAGCQVLQGVQDGFCGCLTTVSTWVVEIQALKRKHGWAYAFGTLLGGLCLMLVIMGSVRWTVGFSTTACNTGYPDKIHA